MAVKKIATITDHIDQAIDRLPQQFKNLEAKYPNPQDPNKLLSGWEAFLTAFVKPAQDFEDVCKELLVSLDITVATSTALDKIGALVGKSRTDVDDDVYRKDIFIQIGSNTSEGTYEDITDLYGLYGLDNFRYLEPAPATFYFNLGVVERDDLIPINNMTDVAKAAGVAYQMSGVVSDPSNPIPKDQPLFVFKDGGEGESFGVLQEDEETIVGGGRYSLLLSDTNYVPPSGSEQFAVGAIQMSVLDEEDFATAMGTDAIKWVLADGREVNGSECTRITSNETVPDMAGTFARMADNQESIDATIIPHSLNLLDVGIETDVGGTSVTVGGTSVTVTGNANQFNNDGSSSAELVDTTAPAYITFCEFTGRATNPAVDDNNTTPVPAYLNTGAVNKTTNVSHRHALELSGNFSSSGTTNTGTRTTDTATRETTILGGIDETRPVNMSVNYYIKIN